MSTTAIPDRFTTLPDEPVLQTTVVPVMTSTSVTLDQAGGLP